MLLILFDCFDCCFRLTSTKSKVTKLKTLLEERDQQNAEMVKEYNKLMKQKDALEVRVAKGEYNPATTRVLHLTMNPVKQARQEYREQVNVVRNELVNKLTALGMIDQEGSVVTTSLVERQPMDNLEMMNILLALRQDGGSGGGGSGGGGGSSGEDKKVLALQKKLARFQEVFKKLRQKYKEIVYLLTGWKINMDQVGNVHVASVYAESEHDILHFKYAATTGSVELLSNTYSEKLNASDSDAIVVLTTTR